MLQLVGLRFRSYATPGDLLQEQVALNIRPWQLPYRRDYGLRGVGDSDPTSGKYCTLSRMQVCECNNMIEHVCV